MQKNIEYEFKGKDIETNSTYVVLTNEKKYFLPHIIKFDFGLEYKSPLATFSIFGTTNRQITSDKLDLLKSIKLNIGITRNIR